MIVGLPGAGISGIFYLACVFLMPFHAAWEMARGHDLPAGHWRRIARHWLIGAGILAVLYAVGWGISLAAPGAAPAPESAGGDTLALVTAPSPMESLAKIGALLTGATLVGVVVLVQVMSLFFRGRGSGARATVHPAAASPAASSTEPKAVESPVVVTASEPDQGRRFRRVLVTGGAGFIGSHIAEALVASGCETVVLDDLSAGIRAQVPERAHFIHADIADRATVQLIADARPDLVIHAAARVSVSESMSDPARDRAVNVVGTQHVIDGARAAGARRIVFISSGGAVYGDTPAADELSVPAPANYYGIHKLTAEGYLGVSGLPYGIVRFANVYGPRQRAGLEGGVVAIFLEAIRAGHPITIFGSGNQVRDFLYVSDAVSGVLSVAGARQNGTWNVGTGVATSVNALLAQLESVVAPVAGIRWEKARPGDVESSRLVVDRIRSDIGWAPRVTLHAGIRQLAAETGPVRPREDGRPCVHLDRRGIRTRTRDLRVAEGRLSGGTLPSSH